MRSKPSGRIKFKRSNNQTGTSVQKFQIENKKYKYRNNFK